MVRSARQPESRISRVVDRVGMGLFAAGAAIVALSSISLYESTHGTSDCSAEATQAGCVEPEPDYAFIRKEVELLGGGFAVILGGLGLGAVAGPLDTRITTHKFANDIDRELAQLFSNPESRA